MANPKASKEGIPVAQAHSDINIIDPEQTIPRLLLKLEEYHERRAEKDTAEALPYTHPELLPIINPLAARRLLAATTLGAVLDIWLKQEGGPVTIAETALRVSNFTQLDVQHAAEVPFIYDPDGLVYSPDYRQLRDDPVGEDFSDVYRIIKGYCENSMWGIQGGTGLPELPK